MKSRFTPLRLPLLLALALCAASTRAATLNVPAQYPTIQAGIDAAAAGDIVLIADGTYQGGGNVNLDFGGKNITVTSQNGAGKTVIDCQSQSGTRGVTFHGGEGAAAMLQGVTVENGFAAGGAVLIGSGSSPTLAGCVFANNIGTGTGGAVGAALTCHPSIVGCTFAANKASSAGGGLYAQDRVTVTSCAFIGNTTQVGNGGGADFEAGGSAVTGCTFTGNTAGGSGGGVAATGGHTLINCVFTGNTSQGGTGGGFFGAGSLINCTFTGNTAANGAGVAFGSLTNCILFGDSGTELYGVLAGSVTYSDIQGGYAGTGNVNLNPLFVSAPGDLHLRNASPLLGGGTAGGAPITTLDGFPRPALPAVGAFETGANPLPASADTSVLSSAPAQNSGNAPTLTVGGFLGAAYLQFDLSALPPLTTGSTVRLRLNAGRALPGAASLVVSATTTRWTELSLTFQTRPPLGLPLGFLNLSADGQTAARYDVDVTAYAKAQQALGNARIGLALTQFATGLPVGIDSRENPANDGPQLVVTY